MTFRSAAHSDHEETERSRRAHGWRAFLRGLFAKNDLDVESWRKDAGVGKSCAHRFFAHHDATHFPLSDVETLPRPVRTEVVRRLAHASGFDLVEQSTPEQVASFVSDVLLYATTMKEQSDVAREYAEAIGDSQIDPEEGEAITRECTEAIEALTTLRDRAQRAVRARGDGVVLRAVKR